MPREARSGATLLLRPVRFLLFAVVLASAAAPAMATRIRPLNLDEMTSRSGVIVFGRCTGVRTVHDANLDRDITEVTVRVERTLKGAHRETRTFRTVAPSAVGGPVFEVGEELVLFLYPEGRLGLTSPVGLSQGRFRTVSGKHGRRIASNGHDPSLLTARLAPESARRIAPHLHGAPPGGGLPIDTLLAMVEALQRPAGGRSR